MYACLLFKLLFCVVVVYLFVCLNRVCCAFALPFPPRSISFCFNCNHLLGERAWKYLCKIALKTSWFGMGCFIIVYRFHRNLFGEKYRYSESAKGRQRRERESKKKCNIIACLHSIHLFFLLQTPHANIPTRQKVSRLFSVFFFTFLPSI